MTDDSVRKYSKFEVAPVNERINVNCKECNQRIITFKFAWTLEDFIRVAVRHNLEFHKE